MPERVVALLPLRGGSRGIPGKNIKEMAGRPLCYWTLAAAANCPSIDAVYVSTDSTEIAAVATSLGLGVQVVNRPAEFATDTASTESVMLHFASVVPFDLLVLMQATSPLLTSDDLTGAIEQFQQQDLDSMLSAVRVKRFFWAPDGTALNYNPAARPRRQDFAGTFMENGAFYLTQRHILEQERCRLGGKMAVFEMPEDTAVELDAPEDWAIVEQALLARQRRDLRERARGLRLVCVDVDGTLTDGGMYYSPEGEALKRFDTRDARGLHDLIEHGLEVVVMTTEDSLVAEARCRKLGIPCYRGVSDKRQLLQKLCAERDLPTTRAVMIGDDVNDLPAMQVAGLSCCPADAQPEIRQQAAYVAKANAGHGAVREIARFLLELRR